MGQLGRFALLGKPGTMLGDGDSPSNVTSPHPASRRGAGSPSSTGIHMKWLWALAGIAAGIAVTVVSQSSEAGRLIIMLNGEPLFIVKDWYRGGAHSRQLVEWGPLENHISVWLMFDKEG